jgi:manganese/zinc/iron transport system substrate-binding protein
LTADSSAHIADGMKSFLCLFTALVLAVAPATAQKKLSVTATTGMVADLVRQVGGERVQVEALMGAGVDPHLYKAAASDMTKLQRAQIVFYSGLMLEGQMAELFDRLAQKRKVIAVTAGIPEEKLIKPAGGAHPDPHVWGDAELWSLCTVTVAKALTEADPAGGADYAKRADAHRADLMKLHAWAKERVQALPAGQRILITSHDAFNYLGRAYGLEVVGVQGISTVTEAGLADIVKVTDFIKKKEVKAVFVESSVPKAAIERISKDSGAKIGGELFSDALGTAGKMHTVAGESYDEGTVVGMLKFNINTIVGGLK